MSINRSIVLLIPMVFDGCQSVPVTRPDEFQRNDLRSAADAFETGLAEGASTDRTVHLLEAGLARLTAGDLESARGHFAEARARMGILWGENQEHALTILGEESDKEFKGEPFEQSLCCLYEGWIALAQGHPGNAKACFLASELNDRTAGLRSDFVLPNLFEALARIQLGDREVAEEVLDYINSIEPAAREITELARKSEWNAVFLIEVGHGPVKLGTGQYKSTLSYTQDWCGATAVSIRAGTTPVATARVGRTYRQATEKGLRLVDRLNQREAGQRAAVEGTGITFASGAAGMVVQAQEAAASAPPQYRGEIQGAYQDVAGAYAIAGGVLIVASMAFHSKADTRGWTTLPEAYYVGLANLPVNSTELAIDALDSSGRPLDSLHQDWVNVPVNEGLNLYHLRLLETRPGGDWQTDRWGLHQRRTEESQ